MEILAPFLRGGGRYYVALQLDERSLEWPEDLRGRWTYAAALGAFSGFVF